jgi:type VI secretion system protein ImpM
MSTQDLCGLFGKLPQQSDFVTLHLSQAFTETWHEWLQASMSVSQEQLGDDWLQQYLVSPVWHFAIMPGIVDQQAAVGLVIPSVDEVGRYYPLALACVGDYCCWGAYLYGQAWFQSAQSVLLSALSDNTTYSDLIGALENLALPEWPRLQPMRVQSAMDAYGGNTVVSTKADVGASEFAHQLLANSYFRQYGSHSLWWSHGTETIPPSLAVNSHLPDPGQFAAFLDGQWQQWGWVQELEANT